MRRMQCCSVRDKKFVGWLLPAAILTAIPKCPICLAAYLALATGFEISLTTAAHIRVVLMLVCAVCLGVFAFRQMRTC